MLPAGIDLVVLNGAPLELAGRVALEGDLPSNRCTSTWPSTTTW
jgi:hypothetical protein